MSGDVQPRKRKDKRRKKEDTVEDVVHQTTQPAASPSDDVNIHVHKERSTGGGICAKFVFFILLAVLAVLIGLIITEHRGLTDLDASSTESRFSEIFDGWTDESALHDDHDNDELQHSKELESHEDDDEEEHDVDEDDHDDDDEHEDNDDDDHESQDDDENDETEEARSVVSEEEMTEEETIERTEEEDEEADETMEQDDYDVDETIEKTDEEADDDDDADDDQEESVYETVEETARSGEEESMGTTETYEESEEVVYNDDVDTNDDDDDHDGDDADGDKNDSEENAIRDSAEEEGKEEEEAAKSDGRVNEADGEDVDFVEGNEEAPTNIGVVKFGVGVSLLVVAYVVLVKKWRTDKVISSADEAALIEEVPDLTRRNTIVMPPTLDEIVQELESDEEDYTDEEDEVDDISHDVRMEHSPKRQYQELRNVYTRTLTPDDEYDRSPVEDEYDDEHDYDRERYGGDEDDDEEDDEDVEDIEEIENEDDDKELLKRLEAKYGKIRHSDEEDDDKDNEDEEDEQDYDDYEKLKPWRRSDDNIVESDDDNAKTGAQSYHLGNITNEEDWPIRQDLDNAQDYLPNSPADALSLFNKILELYPHSPRALYGKSKSLDLLAEMKQSNNLLQESIDYYLKVITYRLTPEALFRIAAERCVDRMRFIGQYGRAIFVQKLLVEKYPNIPEYSNQLAVTYLTINKVTEAKELLNKTLIKWPNDGFALVHYGFILKTTDNNIKEAVSYLKKGIDSNARGVVDGRFYFHLGDALTRLGRENEAYKVYEDGVLKNVFLSKYQRSLYNVNRLRGKPWWKEDDLPVNYQTFFKLLKSNWKIIRDEGLAALNRKNTFKNEAENLRDVGDWKQFELYARGVKYSSNCQKCPKTCKIMDTFSDASNCRRGQIKFSVMEPGTHVWPHCGPTNCRLRLHLGLKIPPKTFIRVADETRTWGEGQLFIFDDSFEHEVWHNGTEFRLVLIVDMWHPDLTLQEKTSLSAI